VAAGAICIVLAIHAWRRRPAPGAAIFAVMMLAVADWTIGYALELGSANLPLILFWARLEYIGIIAGPVAAMLLALAYTGRTRWLTRRRIATLAIIPAITLLLVWTNDLHGLIWSESLLEWCKPDNWCQSHVFGRSMLNGGADTSGQSVLERHESAAQADVAAPNTMVAPDGATPR
jgi:hypothetical protein